MNETENRPWGKFEVLAKFGVEPQGDVCIKIITVKPGQRLSYQAHRLRCERWTFVQGRGTVVLDDEETTVVAGSGIFIPVGARHRVINVDSVLDLVFVEVSTGSFDENDIERFEDDYGRAAPNEQK